MWSVYWSWARCYNHNVLNHCGIPQLGLQCRSTHPPRVSVPFHTLEGASRTGRQFPLPPFLPSLPSCLIAIAGTLVVIFITSNLTIALFFQLIFFKSLATLIQLTRGHQIYFYEISLNLCLFFIYIYSNAFSKGSALPTMPAFYPGIQVSLERRLTLVSPRGLVAEPYFQLVLCLPCLNSLSCSSLSLLLCTCHCSVWKPTVSLSPKSFKA